MLQKYRKGKTMKNKLLLIFSLLILSSLSVAQNPSERTNEELIQMARQECLTNQGFSSDEYFALDDVAYEFNDDYGKRWVIIFFPQPDENDFITVGSHIPVRIHDNGKISCHSGE